MEGYVFDYWFDGQDVEMKPFDFTLPIAGEVYLYPFYQVGGVQDNNVQAAAYQTMPEMDNMPDAILDMNDSSNTMDLGAGQILNTVENGETNEIAAPAALPSDQQELKTITGSAHDITVFNAVQTGVDILDTGETTGTDDNDVVSASTQMGLVIDFSDIADLASDDETKLALNLHEGANEVELDDENMIFEDIEDEAIPLAGPADAAPYVQIDYDFSESGEGETLVTMTANLCNVPDDLNVSYHWQNDESGDYADVEGANARIYTFSASEYKEGISWRCAVDIIG